MPASAEELVALLDLETIDLNLFRGQQPNTQLQRVFGGQVAAQALVAAARTAPEDMPVHSMHSYFVRPGDTAVPIVYDVDRVRDGRSFSTRRVLARQHGRPIYGLTASFQVEEKGFEHQDAMPDAPTPEESFDVSAAMKATGSDRREEWLREWSALDLRHAGDSGPGGSLAGRDHPSLVRYWIRVSDRLPDDDLVHRAALTYISDMTLLGATLVPHGLQPMSPGVQAASLDHTVWFHRPYRADEWLLYDQVSPSAAGARGLALGRLFTQDGRLVASVAQEGLIRPRDH
ncbi:MAG: acyl-CoA thioesterase [Nocardioidaceae bacterium]|nr:acyl-CoA thioesterase [Nocardioidaceae bacterium]